MAMTVQCTSCSTSFPVDPAKVPPGGVRARCSTCGSIFRVERPSEPTEPAPRAVEPEAGGAAPEPQPGGAYDPFEGGGASAGADLEEAPPAEVEQSVEEAPFAEAAPTEEAPSAEGAPSTEEAPSEAGADAVGGAAVDDWVVDREPEVDLSELDMPRLDTVEEGMRSAQDELGGTEPVGPSPAAGEAPGPGVPEAGGAGTTPTAEPPPPAGAPGEAGREAPPEQPAAPVQGFTFGKRDPHDKASRLARVLVSDMVTYNSERHQRALAQGTLREDFEDEIKKSWEEYVDQVGRDVAEGTHFFNKALNDILAQGRQVF